MNVFIRLALFYLLVISISISFVLKVFYDEIKPGIRQASEETLVDNVNLLAEFITPYFNENNIQTNKIETLFSNFRQRDMNAKIWSYVKQSSNLECYITNAEGLVVFHSGDKSQQGKDYSQWIDVSRTLAGRYGARTTRLDPEDDLTGSMYVSAPILDKGRIIGVITLIQAHQGIQQFIGPAQQQLLIVGVLLILTLVILGIILANRFNNILRALTNYVNKIRDGEAVDKLSFNDSSFDELANTLHKMRQELDGKSYIEQYIHTLTHELKTPLSAISAAAQILDTNIEGEQKQRFINNIESEVERLRQLVERLLLLASIENNQHKDFNSFCLVQLINDEIESLSFLLNEKNIMIQFMDHRAVNEEVLGDEFLLRMAIRNLLDNAIDFSIEGSRIDVELSSSPDNIVINIFNQGKEIPEYALARIFERFFSTPRPSTGRKSSGLGLCLIKEIALIHRGNITLRNKVLGSGSCGVEAELLIARKSL